ncbi:hypothetical protein [Flavobacterium agrisoli]|uniref:VWA domain-containing protein n=1 Tax=Flavobacterium agrisoli TaxID=2793066 RepID=A0A934PJE8_9FLAO|nr:hypothetical protein [Flavobacterium agrisoli]MBK0368484.1 hypothetical protein [Flavobacterium agrisoli]
MTTNTIQLLLLSILIAVGLSFFQYLYKAKNKSNLHLFLAFLRFISLFSLLVLLINPVITNNTIEIIKTPLPIVVDNSSSVAFLKSNQEALTSYKEIISNPALQEKFEIKSYQFDTDFKASTTFDFKGNQTNFDAVAKSLKSIYKNSNFPTVMITDGNQTTGNDYVYRFENKNRVFPIIVGDTTTFFDLKINQLNANKYAFLKNKFPVEVFLQYSGNKSISADFTIKNGNTIVAKQKVSFTQNNKTAVVNLNLPADKVGLQVFKATISSSINEKNSFNNSKNFAVEIIDQKTTIVLVSNIKHPDIGALKRAIESNAQRKVTLLNPNQIKSLRDYNVLILYQPNSTFNAIFEDNKTAKINTFIITGAATDFNFLNQKQSHFNFKMSSQKEEFLASFNAQFNLFALDNLGFENFPPLENPYGTITASGNVSTLLFSKIRNVATQAPLLCFVENQNTRSAYLFGENSWRWRLQNYVQEQKFTKYDIFIDKIIQFLASDNTKKALEVHHENFYNSGDEIEINAEYFNKNYEFDEKARLTISVQNTQTKQIKNYDLLKSNNSFKVNLNGLQAGKYQFKVTELNSKTTYSSQFEILDFDIEKQFVNPDVSKLQQLAQETNGKAYFANQVADLIADLIQNKEYRPIQKKVTNNTPLIDWYWLLAIIAIALSSEWFIRKYNGLL